MIAQKPQFTAGIKVSVMLLCLELTNPVPSHDRLPVKLVTRVNDLYLDVMQCVII